jgi:hypothetical protein
MTPASSRHRPARSTPTAPSALPGTIGLTAPGSGFGNATHIYLSYSTGGAKTFSKPKVISGRRSLNFMNDRYQSAIVADARGLHATCYERVQNPSGGPDLLREDQREPNAGHVDLPAGELRRDAAEHRALPDLPDQPEPRPDHRGLLHGDYSQVASNGTLRFATWATTETWSPPPREPPKTRQMSSRAASSRSMRAAAEGAAERLRGLRRRRILGADGREPKCGGRGDMAASRRARGFPHNVGELVEGQVVRAVELEDVAAQAGIGVLGRCRPGQQRHPASQVDEH